MVWLVLRALAAHRWRAGLTSLAAVTGVGVVSGALIIADTAERAEAGEGDLAFITDVLLAAGAVALLVGMFTINITFSVTVAQRTRELALLRCLGAEGRQLRRMVLLESLIIGVFSAMGGLILGIGVAYVVRELVNTPRLPGELTGAALVISPRTLAAVVVVGCVATGLSALGPARRARLVTPVAALRDLPVGAGRRRVVRTVIGGLATGGCLGLVLFAITSETGQLLLPAGALMLVGLRLLGPVIAGRLGSVAGLPVGWALRLPGKLARQNAAGNPERTAATVLALTIGLALTSMVTVLGASTSSYILQQTDTYQADFELSAGTTVAVGKPAHEPMSPEVIDRLARLPEVSAAVPVLGTQAEVGGEPAMVEAIDVASLSRVVSLDMVAGSLATLPPAGIGVPDDIAAGRGLTIGAPITIGSPHGRRRTFTVRAIYAHRPNRPYTPGFLIGPADHRELGGGSGPIRIFVRRADRVSQDAARAAIDRAVAGLPAVTVRDRSAVVRNDLDQVRGAMRVYVALTALASLVGVFGIVSVLTLSVVERSRELGLLRAVGMHRRQVMSMVCAEAVITVLAGIMAGLGIGAFFGWAGAQALRHSSSPTRFTLPIGMLAAAAALTVLVGVTAAILPAWWAARVDVLRAIATGERI